jgi:lactate 2-monooxygenase
MTAKAGSVQAAGGPGRARQAAIFRAGARGHKPSIPTDAATLERRAKKAMSPTAWAYVAGGAGEGCDAAAENFVTDRVERDSSSR